ncbi:ClpP/crotonase [Metschnikowia bicuspidata var. bicuspidata NRRL YB-4993]|uniref:ClpP/crotonase n=1 Tax=Metschnikowia bicuspidata var. bicuspidata NRRL YB-4993 TaxID=869754 RepID=A0A1A0HF63_9ASCO|nr:ClpP/crotonase [Metschnikowia bicuspidata var. bicuspidata NRRL YB-4993]OBA22774.1 ClpP/crotonase [Metschnikowia bicuspidata var. bicuspidata NRRL YB-4993]
MTFDAQVFARFEKWAVKEIEPGFVHVMYNNPKTLNAYAEEDWRAYHEILTQLDSDADTNVILISSSFSKAFSSGLNLKAAMLLVDTGESQTFALKKNKMYAHIREFQDAIATPARMRTPTIALLNGVCYGLAIDIASACSIRIATQDVRFSIREIKIGIVADMGSLQRITNLVGNKSLVHQYALTGEVFGAEQALGLGFVSEVVPDFDAGIARGLELGQDINSNPQWAIKGTKESIQFMVDGGGHEQGLLNIAEYNAVHLVGGLPANGFGKPKL